MILIGTPWAVVPVTLLAFQSHWVDDFNVGSVRVEHVIETFDPEWQKGHIALRAVWWVAILALFIVLLVKQMWLPVTYVYTAGFVAFSWDVIRFFNKKYDPHQMLFWQFWHRPLGSFVWYTTIFVCVLSMTVLGLT